MKKFIILLLLLLLPLGGCIDKHELEDSNFVIILGLDKAGTDVNVTVSFPLTQSTERSGEYETTSMSAPTAIEALGKMNEELPGELAIHSVKTVVISKAFEEDGADSLYTLWRQTELRSTAALLICDGSAGAFVRERVENALCDPLRQEELMLERDKPLQLLDYIKHLYAKR